MIRFSSFYPIKSLSIFNLIYPSLIWNMDRSKKVIYLTFDDGPTPEITPWILDLLSETNIKATFFCIGENVKSHPEIFIKILEAGNSIGNHTNTHVDGWKTSKKDYLSEVESASKLIRSNLFRPPYGRITRKQIKELSIDYKLIMWDILSGDFDSNNTAEQCIKNVINNAKNGSIIVMHDSLKASENLKYSLPTIINDLKEKGFEFKTL